MNLNNWTKAILSDLIVSIEAGTSVNAENRTKDVGEIGVLKTSAVVYGILALLYMAYSTHRNIKL